MPPTPMNVQDMGADTGESKRSEGGPSTATMINLNNLTYNLEPDLSVVTNATFKQHFFQQTEYSNNQRATCILNTGADYVDTRRRWVVFTLVPPDAATDPVTFGPMGSVLNLINRVTVASRSGDELSRTRRLNLCKASLLPYKMDSEWWKSTGSSLGQNATLYDGTKGADGQTGSLEPMRFVIPLYLLSDLFGYGRFLPSMLTSGMRIEIEWEQPDVAFTPMLGKETIVTDAAKGSGWDTYTIKDLHINARSIQLTDAVQRHLNELSATNGLEIVYTDWETTEQAKVAGTQINLEVRKASSRALKAYGKIRYSEAKEGTRDSMVSAPFSSVQHQWQLGSLYFPHQPIKASKDTKPFSASQESYLHLLDSFTPKSGIAKSAMPLRGPGIEKLPGAVVTRTADFTMTSAGSFADTKSGDHIVFFNTSDAGYAKHIPIIREVKSKTDANVVVLTEDFTVENGGTIVYGRPYKLRESYHDREPTSFGVKTNFQNNASLLACCLERSALFNLSGIPINNSRVLLLRATTYDTADKDVTIFLQYVKLARVFLNNCEVEQ